MARDRSSRHSANQRSRGTAIHTSEVLDLISHRDPDGRTTGGRICIVTGEMAGPDFNGGIGTANRGLALALQNAGFTVDVLYTRVEEGRPFCFRGSFEEQVAAFQALGINLMCIDHRGRWNDWLAKSLRVLEALQSKSYDLAFFDDTHGNAYYTALAKRTGLPALSNTKLVVVTHSATQWICELNQSPVTTLADIQLLEIERRSIELADFVVSPSAYILGKYRSYGWTLPPNTLVRPNILPFTTERNVPPTRRAEVDEIVFFGRLERRKGLWLFCETLDRLKYELAGKKVTFLGKFTSEDGESTGFTLLRRSAEWPFAPTLLYNYDRDQALAYLKGGNRLAVMPSREDNSPCVILECLVEGIPFIASSGSGGQELIREEDRQNCLFEPTADGLAAKLRQVLAQGATTAQPSFAPRENARETIAWIADRISDVRKERSDARQNAEIQKQSPGDMACTLLLLASDGSSAEQVQAAAREAALRHADCQVMVFTDSNFPSDDKLSPAGNLAICESSSFHHQVQRLKTSDGMIALCMLEQPVPAEALSRAATAFQKTKIDALTMMRGRTVEVTQQPLPFVFARDTELVPESFKTGNAQALMALSDDSNAGLLLIRSELAEELAAVSPIDPQLCRLKDIRLYVHEVLLRLTSAGKTFELVPDCFLPSAALSASRETFDLPALGMRHLLAARGIGAGTDAALLSRLSIEILVAAANRNNALEALSELSARMGEETLKPNNFWPPSVALATYARIAHASGRPDLALSLMASSIGGDNPDGGSADDTPSAIVARRAQTVDLVGFVAQGRHSGMNLDSPWSLRVSKETSELEIHPNGSHLGQATLIIPNLSFPTPVEFVAELELLPSAKGPVKFEIEFQNGSGETFNQSWAVQPGERQAVTCVLPPAFQPGCDLLLSTSMLKRRDPTEGAHAKWFGPAFRPR